MGIFDRIKPKSDGASLPPTTPSNVKATLSPRFTLPALSGVKHLIAVASGKGGVGKSTVSTNVALGLRKLGYRVGLLDADIYGPSQPRLLGAMGEQAKMPQNQITPIIAHDIKFISMASLMGDDSPVVWRAPMAVKAVHQFLGNVAWGDLDYLLVDLPPGTGDVQLTLAQSAPLTGAVIITTPQQVALGIARKGLQMFQQVNVPILGVIENMSGFTCDHCGKETKIFKEGGGLQLSKEMQVPYLGAIPLDPQIMEGSDTGRPIVEQYPDSHGAKAFLSAAQNLTETIARSGETALEPNKIEWLTSGELVVYWTSHVPGGHRGFFRPYGLRTHCACALCVDENTGRRILDEKKVPLDIQIQQVVPQGRYALGIAFTDGHNSGLYTYKRLQSICECEACSRGKQPASFDV